MRSNQSIYLVIFIILLLVSKPSCAGQMTDDRSVKDRKQQVENGLLLRYFIEGIEPELFSITDRMREYNVPGLSIAVINNGEIEWTGTYGLMNNADPIPVTDKTMFQAASISKPVAAIAALMFVEEGVIDLDEDVNDYLKTWKVPVNRYNRNESVTLRRLLNHTSGLTVHGFPGYAVDDSLPSVPDILNGDYPSNTAKVFADAEPGSMWRYSGGGYAVLQKLLADVSGKKFEALMDEYVLGKLNMTSSTYTQPLTDSYKSDASSGHFENGEVVYGNWHRYPEQAAAGLWTTASDLAKIAIELQQTLKGRSEKLIKKKTAEEMLMRGLNNWGLGFSIGGSERDPFFSHGGANQGFRAHFVAYAHSGRGVIIMTNSDNGGELIGEILRAVSDVYNWPDFKQRPIIID